MTLPKEISEEIKQKSLEYLSSFYTEGYVKERYLSVYEIPPEWNRIRDAHEAGATEWAGKAEGLVKALEEIAKQKRSDGSVSPSSNIARKALADYRGKKEGGDG